MFKCNGKTWNIAFVEPYSHMLMRSDGSKTVGVTDDKRTYDYTIAIRAINSVDGVTAEWSKIPLDILENISRRITNEVDGINRVVYDITSKPPATVEWE